MNLAKLSIKQPIFISMVLLALTLVGILAYQRMGVDLFPDISNPVVSVTLAPALKRWRLWSLNP
ncbi:MAG: multidrug transporter AcrB [Dehalococcoidia bacterium]|nr:multidrug transporter AcrB [Dehalococcoidia bacterium]